MTNLPDPPNQYRIAPYPDGKWHIEKYQLFHTECGLFSKRPVYGWSRVPNGDGFETIEQAQERLKFISQEAIYA